MAANKYYYAHIDPATNECVGILTTRREMNRDYLILLNDNSREYIGLYFYDGAWWERVWNEYETVTYTRRGVEYTEEVPVEESGYVDHLYNGPDV